MGARFLLTAVSLGVVTTAITQGMVVFKAGDCTPSAGPDVMVGRVTDTSQWGTIDGVTAYTIGTDACNIGDEVLPWYATSNNHPVIAGNIYRLLNGRFEQIGVSWVKHGFGALALDTCCECEDPNDFQVLGVGCSDPYRSGLNGLQEGFGGGKYGGLGPRSDINASNGYFEFPYTTQGQAGDALYKRIQVLNDDLDPELNTGALYFAEAHYVSPHDAEAGNQNNNASRRDLVIGDFSNGGWELSLTGPTARQSPGIEAWAEHNPDVSLEMVDVVGDGRFILAHRCTDNGDGTWHYEYALYNMNSHRSAQSFRIPVSNGVSVTNVGFHDIDYHSGEIYDSTDWPGVVNSDSVSWSTDTFDVSPNANALRWGTVYNFRFDADTPPAASEVSIDLFRPGKQSSVEFSACGPSGSVPASDLNGDGVVDAADLALLLGQWGPCRGECRADLSGDGEVNAADLAILLGDWS